MFCGLKFASPLKRPFSINIEITQMPRAVDLISSSVCRQGDVSLTGILALHPTKYMEHTSKYTSGLRNTRRAHNKFILYKQSFSTP